MFTLYFVLRSKLAKGRHQRKVIFSFLLFFLIVRIYNIPETMQSQCFITISQLAYFSFREIVSVYSQANYGNLADMNSKLNKQGANY